MSCISSSPIFGCIGCLLMLIGFATPGWIDLSLSIGIIGFGDAEVHVRLSIWYVRACYNDICTTTSVGNALAIRNQLGGMSDSTTGLEGTGLDHIMEYVLESVISLIGGAIGVIFLFNYASNPTGKKISRVIGLFCMLVSGIAATIVIVKMIQVNNRLDGILRLFGYDVGHPFSIVLTGMGVFGLFLSVCCMFTPCVQKGGQAVRAIKSGSGVQLDSVITRTQGYTILDEPQDLS